MSKPNTDYASELHAAVKSFIDQPLNNPLTRSQIMDIARIALPALEQQQRGECEGKWIEWGGGKRPVIASTRVDIKFRDGDVGLAQNANWDWRHHGYGSDIIAYRVVKP